MIKRIFGYGFLLIVSYAIFLIANLPSSFVWKQLQPLIPLQQLPFRIEAVAGTVWQGQVLARAEGIPVLCDWKVDLLGAISGQLPVAVRVKSLPGELKGNLRVGMGDIEIENLKGVVRLDPLNPALSRQRLTLAGDVAVRSFNLSIQQGRINNASADIAWSGGNISYPAGRSQHDRMLPAFRAQIATIDGESRLSVRDSEATFDVISGAIDQNGIAMLEVTRRVLDLAREPWPSNSTEKDVVFKVKRKLYLTPSQG